MRTYAPCHLNTTGKKERFFFVLFAYTHKRIRQCAGNLLSEFLYASFQALNNVGIVTFMKEERKKKQGEEGARESERRIRRRVNRIFLFPFPTFFFTPSLSFHIYFIFYILFYIYIFSSFLILPLMTELFTSFSPPSPFYLS